MAFNMLRSISDSDESKKRYHASLNFAVISKDYASRLLPQPISRPEYPRNDAEGDGGEDGNHSHADNKAHLPQIIETPAESADEVDNRVQQRYAMPEWRQHFD